MVFLKKKDTHGQGDKKKGGNENKEVCGALLASRNKPPEFKSNGHFVGTTFFGRERTLKTSGGIFVPLTKGQRNKSPGDDADWLVWKEPDYGFHVRQCGERRPPAKVEMNSSQQMRPAGKR